MKLIAIGLTAIATMALTACGGGGGGGSTVSTPLTCTAPQVLTNGVCVTPAPTVSVQISKSKTTVGSGVTVSWSSTNATSCVGLDSFAGSKAINNSEVITPTAGGQYTYTISCDGAGGTAKQSVALIVPIPILRSSYENKIAAGKVLGPVTLPLSNPTEWLNGPNVMADFLQDGTYSLFIAGFQYDNSKPQSQAHLGKFHFYKQVNGTWNDVTKTVLNDDTGCLHPRKAMVADLNGDGKPDVVIACHGYDASPFPGEQQRILLSQANGTYKNLLLPITAYAHGGSVADLNGNGYSDIIYTDTSIRKQPFYLVNNKDGTFTEDVSRMPQTTNKFTCFTTATCGYGIYSMEFIDYTVDGKYDLWVGGWYDPTDSIGNIVPTVFLNNGSNMFSDVQKLVITPATTKITTLDIIFEGGKLYTLYETGSYSGVNIDKFDVINGTSKVIYSHTGSYGSSAYNSTVFGWMLLNNNNIMANDALYNVSIPLQ